MSYILKNKLYKKLDKVKTTKELIYKDKIIDVHDIKGSYKKLVKEGIYNESVVTYGKEKLYLNYDALIETIELLISIAEKVKTNKCEIIKQTMTSEILHSLWIEGIHSSKKVIKQILKKPNEKYSISKLITNYKNAFNFISTTKEINEKNLYTLYSLLTVDIDMKEEALDGFPYRLDDVQIGKEKYKGISPQLIKESMDSIFNLIKNESEDNEDKNLVIRLINVAIFHYLFEIVHPYYDMNGRTGRLLSNWYAETSGLLMCASLLSESINMFKNELYYKAFEESEINGFKLDATYFVQSFFIGLIAQKSIFLTIKEIDQNIKNKYKTKLNDFEKDILSSLLSKDKDKHYKKEGFIMGVNDINQSLTSKALNNLETYGLVESINTKPKEYKLIWTKEIETIIDQTLEK